MTDMLRDALALAAEGIPVFPVGADKAPRTAHGFKDATTDEATIRSWDWNGGGLIGRAIRPGEVIIDIDPRNGGAETMARMAEAHDGLDETYTVRTRSGGLHLYFTCPPDATYRALAGPGVDVKRAGKGYVVTPPSAGYEVATDAPVARIPGWLAALVHVEERPVAEGDFADPKYFLWEAGTTYGLAAMEGELKKLRDAGEGGRNDALNKAAFALAQLSAGGELRPDDAREALEEVAEEIGLTPHETRLTIDSGWRAGEVKPRQAPAADETAKGDRPDRPVVERMPAPTFDPTERRWADWSVDEPAPPFLLHPIIPRNAYVLVYGATEASKSMAFVGMLAEGSRQGFKVSVYSLENPPHTDRDRLRRLRPNSSTFRLSNDPLDLNDPRQLAALVESEKSWGADVILIDTYSHAFNSRSEDGNAKAIEFARRVRYIMHEVGCSVVLIDHTGYAQVDEPRDASAKRQQVDVAVLMRKEGEWVPGQPARFSMANRKAARFANPFFIRGEVQDRGPNREQLHIELRSVNGGAVEWRP